MSVRAIVVAATVVCLVAAPALAKPGHGPPPQTTRSVSISGPGIDGAIDHGGESRAARLLTRHSGFTWVLERGEPLAVISPPRPTERGPRFEVVYRLTTAARDAYGLEDRVFRQHLFPYADTRPWAYLPAGQGLPVEGWWPVSVVLVSHFDLLGLPKEGDTEGRREAAAEGAASQPSDGTPWLPGAVVAVLAAGALTVRARRREVSPGT